MSIIQQEPSYDLVVEWLTEQRKGGLIPMTIQEVDAQQKLQPQAQQKLRELVSQAELDSNLSHLQAV